VECSFYGTNPGLRVGYGHFFLRSTILRSARHGEGHRLVWNPFKKGLFEVRSFYEELIRKDGPSFPSFPWKNIWCVKAPTMVAFFVWSATLGKILTHDNLRKRNVIVIEWCLCKKSGESIDHLLLHCEIVRDLWSYILILFGVEWVMPRSVLKLLNSWGPVIGCGRAKEAWSSFVLIVVYLEGAECTAF